MERNIQSKWRSRTWSVVGRWASDMCLPLAGHRWRFTRDKFETRPGNGFAKQGTTVPYYVTSRAARGGGGSFKNRKPIGKIRCCESRNVFVGGNSKTATAVKNLDAITECEAHDYCFANCFQTCQEGPFSVDFTVCSNLGIWPRSKTCTNCLTFQLTNGLVD